MNVYEDKCLREKVNHIIAAQKEGEIIIAAYKDGCGLTERANRGKQKTRVRNTLVFFSSGEPIRTTDLRVMSPTSYHCSTPHRKPEYITKRPACQIQFSNQCGRVST